MPLPRLLLIADGFASGRAEMDAASVRARAVRLVEVVVPWVSLRDHEAEDAAFRSAATALAADLRAARPDVLLSVHGRLDVAREIGAGLHAGRHGAGVSEAVGAGLDGPVGASVHSASAALSAAKAGAAYVTLSPVFQTRTHPEAAPAGVDALRLAAERAGVPVFALGGMTPPRAKIARLVGAHGAAAIASLLYAFDAERTVSDFLRLLA